MKVAYLDCSSGICGSMIVGAFLDAGLPIGPLQAELAKLGLDELTISVQKTMRRSLSGSLFRVHDASGRAPDRLPSEDLKIRSHPHGDHRHPHGKTHSHSHFHQGHDHSHAEHGCEESEHGRHEHRNLSVILAMLRESKLPSVVKDECGRIFTRLADAEAKVHGVTRDDIHFHEVGALDAIADIVCAVSAKHLLGIDRVVGSPVAVGGGTVRCAHGLLPVPAPATVELLLGVPLSNRSVQMELTTPTGAAILTEWAAGYGNPPDMTVSAIGYGAGEKDMPHPNLLRVLIGSSPEKTTHHEIDHVVQIETHLDDMTPEDAAVAMGAILDAGALDVGYSPLVMKKGRLGVALVALCAASAFDAVCQAIFVHTSAIGLRHFPVARRKLPRTNTSVETEYGMVTGKEVSRMPGEKTFKPDHDACAELARRHGVASHRVRACGESAWRAREDRSDG